MDNLAQGMRFKFSGKISLKSKREHLGRGYKVPNGGIYSTPNDLAKFIASNMGLAGKLSKSNLAVMQREQIPDGNYGLGFGIKQDSTISIVWHSGLVTGYTCSLLFEKESQYGVVLMRNYVQGATHLTRTSVALIRKLKALESE